MNCKICGRRLTNPSSIQRGVGPICGKFLERIKARHGSSKNGSIDRFIETANPCFSCAFFEFLTGEDRAPYNPFNIAMEYDRSGRIETFHYNAIPGRCALHRAPADGNKTGRATLCRGNDYRPMGGGNETENDNSKQLKLL